MYNWICVSIFFNWVPVVHFSGAIFDSLATGRPTACLSIWLSLVSSDWRTDHILYFQKSNSKKNCWKINQLHHLSVSL